MTKQLFKVIEVVKISDVTEQNAVARELALVKVATTKENRSAVIEIVDVFRAKIVDVAVDSLVVEVDGHRGQDRRADQHAARRTG